MGGNTGASELHSLKGPIDRAVLIIIRDVISDEEPLATADLDDLLDPRVLELVRKTRDSGRLEALACGLPRQITGTAQPGQ